MQEPEPEGLLRRPVGIHVPFSNTPNFAVQQHTFVDALNRPAEHQEQEQPLQPYYTPNGPNIAIRQQQDPRHPLDRSTISLVHREAASRSSQQDVRRESLPSKQGSPLKSPASQIPTPASLGAPYTVAYDSVVPEGSPASTVVLPLRKLSPHAQEPAQDKAKASRQNANGEFAYYEHLGRVAHEMPEAVEAITDASEQCSAELESAVQVAIELKNWFEADQDCMKHKLTESQAKLPESVVTSILKCISHMEPIKRQLAIIRKIDTRVCKEDILRNRRQAFQPQSLVGMPLEEENDDDIRQAHSSTKIFSPRVPNH
eukprot:GEMP01049054.1.p1 GENE.GEMP01049054.1~~GEMP01049054.1.p1  ORF type:complete len:315 (+),score=42.24 GEMP01049054.1:1-945(+)